MGTVPRYVLLRAAARWETKLPPHHPQKAVDVSLRFSRAQREQ